MTTVVQLRLRLSNAFLVKGDRAILIDTGSSKDGDRILAALAREGVPTSDLSLILHTHGHSDHCGSTRRLREVTSAPTAIHPNDVACLEEGRNPFTQPTSHPAKLLHWLVDDSYPSVRADIQLSDELQLREFGVDGKVVFTPGHTAGSVSVLLRNGQAIVGDMLMGGWLGGLLRPGYPRYPYYAQDLSQLRDSVAKVLDLGATTFYVGHGGPIDSGLVRAWLVRRVTKTAV